MFRDISLYNLKEEEKGKKSNRNLSQHKLSHERVSHFTYQIFTRLH